MRRVIFNITPDVRTFTPQDCHTTCLCFMPSQRVKQLNTEDYVFLLSDSASTTFDLNKMFKTAKLKCKLVNVRKSLF